MGQVFAIVLAAIVGLIYFYADTKWGPNERRKRLRKSPFKELRQLGFEEKDNQLVGTFEYFQILAQYNWSGSNGKPSVMLHALFNPKRTNGFIPMDKIDHLNKKHKKEQLIWSINSISREWNFNFKPPKFEAIESFLPLATTLLKEEQLEPLTLEESDAMEAEYLAYLEKQKNQKRW